MSLDCQCTADAYPMRCPVFEKDQSAHEHLICQGCFLVAMREQYRAQWERQRGAKPPGQAAAPPKLLTIGMATANEFQNVWHTVQSLKMFHAEVLGFVELLVVDNAPHTPHARAVKDLMAKVGGRYIPHPEPKGTASPRQRIFDEATCDAVLVIDSHVLLWPETVRRLIHYFHAHPGCRDLLQGPMLDDALPTIYATHMIPEWGSDSMYGRWGKDPRANDPHGEPFEIEMHGLGLFACRREAWPGFNPHMEGFGGEEGYIHEKVRQAGGRVLCLPWLRWLHQFRPEGLSMPYPASWTDRFRNYHIGWREIGWDPAELDGRFADKIPDADVRAEIEAEVEQLGITRFRDDSLAEREYLAAWKTTSDINEHLPTLRRLASEAEIVVELGVRTGVSTRALLAAKPEHVWSVDINPLPDLSAIALSAGVEWTPLHESSLTVEPIPCDLLFIDTLHRADQLSAELARHAPHCRGRIVLHDTETFGRFGEGGGDGLLKAIGDFLGQHAAEWEIEEVHHHNNGLTILKRWNVLDDASRGLGDDVAKVAQALGVGKVTKAIATYFGADCGCAGRQAVLNKWFPYTKPVSS